MIWLAAASVVAFTFMGVDKASARARRARVPEATLLLVALVGGSPGTVAGALVFGHKTRKLAFLAPLAAIVAVQLAVAWWLLA